MTGGEVADLCADGHAARLFIEVKGRRFVDAPAWLPILPIPGTYKHSVYGEIKITRARNERFVSNFNSHVYQEKVPIDGEHLTKESGALGWITELRLNEDGSVDGNVEWNERGQTMLAEDRFAYVSPEWYDQWPDPVDGTVYKDVLIGAALTTRPFFKEKALRSIAQAAEGGLLFAEDPSADLTPLTPVKTQEGRTTPMAEPNKDKDTPVQMSEEVARKFAEMEAQVKAAEEARKAAEAQATQAAERIAALEIAARRKRFEDVVLGKVEGGKRLFGEPKEHVEFLMALAEKFGEDSDQVKFYVKEKAAQAEQIAASEVLRTRGTSGPAPSTAEGKLESIAKSLVERAGGSLSQAKAFAQAIDENPDLYQQYRAETGK